MKVFCKNCAYFKTSDSAIITGSNLYICSHPDNILQGVHPDSWLEPGKHYTTNIRDPQDINILNQCPWYKENPNG